MSKDVAKQFSEIYENMDQVKRKYSKIFPSDWGFYTEFRTDKTLPTNKRSAVLETFGLTLDKTFGYLSVASLDKNKYGVLSGTASCREWFQDSIWRFLKAVDDDNIKLDLNSIQKSPRTNIFWETSAYTKKKYKSLRTWDVLNGGIYCRLIEKYFKNCTEDQLHDQVKLLDIFFGVPYALLDQYKDTLDKRKTTKKGVAGRYIISSKGYEAPYFIYLLPGNVLLRAPWVSSFSIGLLRSVINAATTDSAELTKFLSKLANPKDMRNAMNNSNLKVLKSVYSNIKPLFKSKVLTSGGPGILSSDVKTYFGNCPAHGYGANKKACDELKNNLYRPIVAFEFIVSKGGFPVMDKGLRGNWNLDRYGSSHGDNAVGWFVASWGYCANNLEEYKAFAKSYKEDKANF